MANLKECPPAPVTTAKAGNGLLGKLVIAGFMGGVIAVECLLAYLFIPSASEVAALAEQNMVKKFPAGLVGDEAGTDGQGRKDSIEIDLGAFSLTAPQRNSTTALRVDFHLVGTVLAAEQAEFKHLLDKHPARFRELVGYEIRNSAREDFDDAQLGLIKRRILERSSDLFGKPILKSLIFDDFSYIEQ